ncbi:hypothetical protein UFOVP59_15 [uncultured Caudovirales phage]|uniref:Calcineurin-like phosphoesterase domain-containing protein n=1 Tax=uncultured Caudovirales phage TaxID=2100421 RepID=A0A6J7WUY4_9CAUD|nr:hypothetical protein UFOVP59_15 [uncultured Caudovirales phage]CAB5220638.1 hypothetical protein UFOVP246_17 [uncultured Caudovirales phage]
MSKTAIVWSCAHSDPSVTNERFSWLGDLIEDIKPDYCIDLGDGADMRSLNSFDSRYPQAIVSQSYQADIESYNESQSRIWDRYRISKKKRPLRIGFEGNHENRIKKAIAADPRIEGAKYGVSFKHLNTDQWFDEYHEYQDSAPAIVDYDGVSYAHYFSSGNYGTAMSGLHHAYSLLQLRNHSSTCGHSHKRGIYFKDDAHPKGIIGLVAGCYKGGREGWAGQAQQAWWYGCVIKREIEGGVYEPQFVSLAALEKQYG